MSAPGSPGVELPAVVLVDDALRHNIALMAEYCASAGVSFAPHIKTHMSAELTRRQLDAGAWGVTVATPAQARRAVEFGAERIVLANQVLDPAALEWIASAPAWVTFLVDSVAAVELASSVLSSSAPDRPVPVLVELGVDGGRTGARGLDAAVEVARAVASSRWLRLAGVETYEGVVPGNSLAGVDGLLTDLGRLAGLVSDHYETDEVILTAGGSTYFDRAAEVLSGVSLDRPSRVVVRAGAYVSHDHIAYTALSPFGRRLPGPSLRPAAELWCRVHSRPAPELAVLGFGKRECPYDLDLPVLLDVPGTVTALNDHHAYVALPADSPLAVGDIVRLGMSHPCTIFDKWDAMPVLDTDGAILSWVRPRVRS